MDIDYIAIAYAGAQVLDLIENADKRKEYDAFLLIAAPVIENTLRRELAELVDEINSAVREHYRVRLVHEDVRDFVEVRPIHPGEE